MQKVNYFNEIKYDPIWIIVNVQEIMCNIEKTEWWVESEDREAKQKGNEI